MFVCGWLLLAAVSLAVAIKGTCNVSAFVVQNASWCKDDGVVRVHAAPGSRYRYRLKDVPHRWQRGAQKSFSGLEAGEHEIEVRDENSGHTTSVVAAVYRVVPLNIEKVEVLQDCFGERGLVKLAGNDGGFRPVTFWIRELNSSQWSRCAGDTCVAALPSLNVVKAVDGRGCESMSLARALPAAVFKRETFGDSLRLQRFGRRHNSSVLVVIDGVRKEMKPKPCVVVRGLCSGAHWVEFVEGTCRKQFVAHVESGHERSVCPMIVSTARADCREPNLGRIKVRGRGGRAPYTISIDNKTERVIVGEGEEVAFDAKPGWHMFVLRDAEGKSGSVAAEIETPERLALGVKVLRNDTEDSEGSGHIEAFIIEPSSQQTDVFFSLNGSSWTLSGSFRGLRSGKYLVEALSSGGCRADTVVFVAKDKSARKARWRATEPIESIEDLIQLEVTMVAPRLERFDVARASGLWVCHDFAGNYHRFDSFVDTVWGRVGPFYHMRHWAKIDGFIYFCHSLLCPPPRSWVKAAARNSKPILGTVVSERNVTETRALFSDPQMFASKLVSIAHAGRFDGWLINMESDVPRESLANMSVFLRMLRQHCIVIMYDSVAHDTGEVSHQNDISHRNQKWLDDVDALMLNYRWKLANLPEYDERVWIGVDAFGRGSTYGGGMDSGRALQEAMRFNLSGVLFAPGWTVEVAEGPREVVESRFWDGILWNDTYISSWIPLHNGTWFGLVEIEARGSQEGLAMVTVSGCSCTCSVEVWCSGKTTKLGLVRDAEAHEMFVRQCVEGWVSIEVWSTCESTVLVSYTHSGWRKTGVGVGDAAVVAGLARNVEAPDVSYFSVGYGSEFSVDGKIWRKEEWVNLAYQSRLPPLGFGPTGETWAGISLRKSYSFGSSLHIVSSNANAKARLYVLSQRKRTAIAIHSGRLMMFVGSGNGSVIREQRLGNGWMETEVNVSGLSGDVSVAVPDGEAWIGALVFFDGHASRNRRCKGPARVDARGVVNWEVEELGPLGVLDIFNDDALVERMVAESSGSFYCPECNNVTICFK